MAKLAVGLSKSRGRMRSWGEEADANAQANVEGISWMGAGEFPVVVTKRGTL